MRKLTFFTTILAVLIKFSLFSHPNAWAGIISVKADNTMDHATISSAIASASPGDIIDIWGIITETGIVIDKNLTIQGKGTESTIVQGASSKGTAGGRIFFINSNVTAAITYMTIQHGNIPADYGGAVWNEGTLTIRHCDISNNTQKRGAITNRPGGTVSIYNCAIYDNITTDWGGGIYNYNADMTIDHSVISYNSAGSVGAVYNLGSNAGNTASVTMTNSTVTGNIMPGNGAVCNYGDNNATANLELINCTISNNTSTNGSGGGIYNIGEQNGTAVSIFTNCTVSGNSSTRYGGGVQNMTDSGTASMTLINCTVADNIADSDDNLFEHRGGGIYTQDADTTLLNTIVANNRRGGGWIDDDLNGSSPGANVTANYSLFEFEDNIDLSGANNIIGSQPNLNLESLADNGGPTHTHAVPNTSSPACNAGTNAGAPSTDQRGYARNGTADIGAFEYQGAASLPVFVSAETSENGSQVEVTFSKAMSDPGAKHTQFSVISDDVQNALTGAMLKPDDNKTIVLTLASPLSFSQTVTIAYTAGDVRAADGTMLASFPQQNVINTAIPHPEITLSLAVSSFDEKGGTATVTAFLSEISGWPVTVNLDFTGTATENTDYTVSENSIVIPALSPSSSITVTGSDDDLDEYDETVIIDIASVINGRESGEQQVETDITDDDPEPEVMLVLSHSPFAEHGGKATVSATLSEESGKDVTVNLDFSGVATPGADYTDPGNSIVISKGTLSNSITITGKGDAENEGNETIIVDIASVVNGTEKEEQQVTAIITDLETIVTLSLSGSPFPENNGKATVTATLSKTTGQDVTVNLSFAGTATINDDYTVSADSILIPAGGTSGNIVITGKDDSFDEPDETVTVDAASVTNATESGEQKVEALILDGEEFPYVSFTSATQAGDEDIGVMTITAQLSTVSGREVILPFTLGGKASQGSDYTITPSPLVFPAGSTTQAIILTVHDDPVIETDETIIITMGEPVNAVTSGTTEHTATIIDNEATGWIINEILADPNGDANGDGSVNSGKDEFVEIVNKTGADANISGWILSDAYGVRHTFPSGTTVADRCAVVVFGGGNPTGVFGHVTTQTANTGTLDLNDSGDTVMLEDTSWTVQAIYVYGPEGGDNQSVTLDPYEESPGIMVKHTTANGSGGALFSPGTEVNGMMFSGCNSPPTTTGIGDATALEDAENTSIDLWPSFADAEDSDSALVYSITNNTNTGIFHSMNISENRYVYLDYAENANGSANVTVRATDTRGRFVETTFTVFVISVNDPPLFVKGEDQVTDEVAEEQEHVVDNWATSISPGPANESGQAILEFTVTNDNNDLFSHQPAVDNSGRLSYTPFAYANGSATVSVSVKDDGGTENSGKDTSQPQTFFITINSIDYPPGISKLPDQSADDSETIGPLNFTIHDGDTPSDKLVLSVNSSNPSLTPENGIIIKGTGENWTITVTPTLNMGGNSVITITVTDESGNSADSAFTVSITKGPVIESVMSAALHNDADNNGTASPGDTLRYTTIISNTGDRDAEGLMFINTIPASTVLTGTVSADRGTVLTNAPVSVINITLGPAEQVNILFDVLISPGVHVGEIISNQGIIAYDPDIDGTEDASWKTDGDKNLPGNQPAEIEIGGIPETVAVKQVSDVNGGETKPGDELKYTVIITNQSDYYINEVIYTDDIPLHTSYSPESVSAPVNSIVETMTPSLKVTEISLPANKEIRLSFRVQTDNPIASDVTEIFSQGTVYYDFDGDGVSDADQKTDGDTSLASPGEQPSVTTVTAEPDFHETTESVALYFDADMNGDVSPGDTLKYTVILQNTGNQDATEVKFTDYLPKNVTYIPGSAIADAGTVVYNIYMNRIEWIGDIGGGTSVEISFHVTVDANLQFGDLIQNQGTVAYDTDCDSINDASETTDSNPDEPGNQPTDIYARGGSIRVTAVKQIANASGTSVRPGDEPEYTIILKNHSGYYAQGIEFTDPIPDNAVYVQGSATVPGDSIPVFEESVLSLTNIAIPAYGKVSLSFRVKLKHVLATGVEELTNQGAVYYDSDGDGVNEAGIKTDSDTGQDGEQPAVTGLIIPYATCFANGISFTTATLNGALNPGAGNPVYYFEYGKTTDYGSKTDEKYAGQGHRNLFVSEHIKGLDEGETYHCRLVVMIGDETYYGADTSFTTSYTAPGPDAIHKNDPSIVAWATGWEDPVEYGIILNDRFMTPENALGKADCDTSSGFVSLGTGGTITLTFSTPVTNGTGYDFAVFENSATDTSLELAYVEVSSDGENFVRFDNESSNSGGNFGQVDSSKIRGLAGKYRQGYGTLFDLAVLTGKLNTEKITHIRITDVFGGRDRDTRGNIIYDATYNLTSARAGFDLDAIGVIHSRILPGDINGDSIINLNDLIMALKILAGSDTDPFFVYIGADVNNDRKIGFEEVGRILRKTSKP